MYYFDGKYLYLSKIVNITFLDKSILYTIYTPMC